MQIITKTGQIIVEGVNIKVRLVQLPSHAFCTERSVLCTRGMLHVLLFTIALSVNCVILDMQTKHVKPAAKGETGQITQNEFPIHHSNVMLYSQQQKVRSRVGYRYAGCILIDFDNAGTCMNRLHTMDCGTKHGVGFNACYTIWYCVPLKHSFCITEPSCLLQHVQHFIVAAHQ